MKRIILAGITGRTGSAVAKVIHRLEGFQIVAAIGKNSSGLDIGEILDGKKNGHYVYPDIEYALEKNYADIYIDFTTPDGVEANAEYAVKKGLDVIIGTTGLTNEYVKRLAALIKEENRFGIISSNFALGIATLVEMGNILKEYFGKEQLQIIEKHHKSKLDCPSGTAIYLQQQLGLEENVIVSKRVSLKTSYHEINYASEIENLSIAYEVTGPEVFGDGVAYVLENMPSEGMYYDLASFMQDVENK